MWTLVQKANAHNLHEHVRLSDALGFRHLVFSLQLHGWGDSVLGEKNAEKEVGGVDVEYLVELGKSLGVRVSFWNTNEKFDTKEKKTLCPWPFERAVVTSDSRTVACCMIGDPDQHELAKGMTFSKAWKSQDYEDFRQAHLDGNLPEVCRGCYK